MNKEFLYTLLDNMSVSGHEIELQKKVIAEMEPHCDQILTDYTGNVISVLNPDAPFKVLLAGHIDEIGLIITHIQENGLLRVAKSGGIHAATYPGHQVVVHGTYKTVYGTVINSRDTEKNDLKAGDLIIDIGAKDAADARSYVQEGDPIHLNTYHQEMLGGFLSARAIDDRGGAFIILEALKRARERGCAIGVYAATTVGEETTMRGAHWAGSAINPNVAIAVDVTHARTGDAPQVIVKLGDGPNVDMGSNSNPKFAKRVIEVARAKQIPHIVTSCPAGSGTNAWPIQMQGQGVTTLVVSLPLKYMHSPVEMLRMSDVKNVGKLLAAFIETFDGRL